MNNPTVVELCAGAGGQAIGLEQAGFEPVVLIENDEFACTTLRENRPNWLVLQEDITTFNGRHPTYLSIVLITFRFCCWKSV